MKRYLCVILLPVVSLIVFAAIPPQPADQFLAAEVTIVPMTAEEAAAPAVVRVTPGPEAGESPQAAFRKRFSRTERKLAREVIQDAARASGMRRLEFLRAVNDGDADAKDELKLSLAQHDNAPSLDPETFGKLLEMVMNFIKQLLALFSMFADNATLDAAEIWCVNVGYQMAA